MPYHYEATSEFIHSISEVEKLTTLASSDEENRTMFLKLAVVSLVTKFQVFVEKVLEEFRYSINGTKSSNLPLYMKMNAVRLSVLNGNPLLSMQSQKVFTEEKKNRLVSYLDSISFISNDDAEINDSFLFKTKFPLGKTGKGEIVELLSQIDGSENPFENFVADDFNKLDSVLQTRHLIIHQDRFTGTETTVAGNIAFLKNLVEYIDDYLYSKRPT